ncbi:MAG: M48 family metalloprotease [Candidatus Heimdallarchaeota archaeon]|nr:M48 family metalloprotease [Candidatus Heimdallarchaeota archaeon]
MSFLDYINQLWDIIKSDPNVGIGILIALVGIFFLVTELKTKIQHGSTSENLMLALIGITFGLVLIFWSDWLMAIALSLFVLAVYQTYQLRESPVWRELMIISMVTYLVFLVGTILDKVFDNKIYSGWAYNIMIFVFIILALVFFGKKFILVSRMMSPQILYLVLFILVYVILYVGTNLLEKTGVIDAQNLMWFYLPISKSIAERVIFLSIAPYEIIIFLSFGMYFVSGPMLTKLLGIKTIDDKRILKLVEEVRTRLNIKWKIKVGYVEAPILNAMAYGPFYDQRIAFVCKNLNEFSDDDVRGIVAHELSHNKRLHVVWLQGLASAEMVIKKAFLLPATTLDYAAYEQKVPFVIYFLINYGIMAFLFIFVRIMEGDADLQTKKAGYGKQLAQTLYKLEGFYQGVAGDFGLNVQLLTGKEFSEEETQRFLGEAAIGLYRNIYRPSRWSMFANIFMSHPRTAYRIISVVDDSLSPVKGALLPYWLLLPNFIRKKTVNNLRKKREDFSELITEKFNIYYGDEGINSYLEITRTKDLIERYMNRYIVAYDYVFDKMVEGEVTGIHVSDSICRPFLLKIQGKTEEHRILVSDYDIHDAQTNNIYILKNGQVGELQKWEKHSKSNKPIFTFQNLEDKSTFTKNYTGRSLDYLENLQDGSVFFFSEGADKLAKLLKIDFNQSIKSSDFEFDVSTEKKPKILKLKGKDLIVELPAIMLRLFKEKIEVQRTLLESLEGKSVIIYTKEELEIGIACILTKVSDDTIHYQVRDKEVTTNLKKVDYIYVVADIPKFMIKSHVSFLDRLIIRLSNRKDMKYIYP